RICGTPMRQPTRARPSEEGEDLLKPVGVLRPRKPEGLSVCPLADRWARDRADQGECLVKDHTLGRPTHTLRAWYHLGAITNADIAASKMRIIPSPVPRPT